jgi:hypothetical protein
MPRLTIRFRIYGGSSILVALSLVLAGSAAWQMLSIETLSGRMAADSAQSERISEVGLCFGRASSIGRAASLHNLMRLDPRVVQSDSLGHLHFARSALAGLTLALIGTISDRAPPRPEALPLSTPRVLYPCLQIVRPALSTCASIHFDTRRRFAGSPGLAVLSDVFTALRRTRSC